MDGWVEGWMDRCVYWVKRIQLCPQVLLEGSNYLCGTEKKRSVNGTEPE